MAYSPRFDKEPMHGPDVLPRFRGVASLTVSTTASNAATFLPKMNLFAAKSMMWLRQREREAVGLRSGCRTLKAAFQAVLFEMALSPTYTPSRLLKPYSRITSMMTSAALCCSLPSGRPRVTPAEHKAGTTTTRQQHFKDSCTNKPAVLL